MGPDFQMDGLSFAVTGTGADTRSAWILSSILTSSLMLRRGKSSPFLPIPGRSPRGKKPPISNRNLEHDADHANGPGRSAEMGLQRHLGAGRLGMSQQGLSSISLSTSARRFSSHLAIPSTPSSSWTSASKIFHMGPRQHGHATGDGFSRILSTVRQKAFSDHGYIRQRGPVPQFPLSYPRCNKHDPSGFLESRHQSAARTASPGPPVPAPRHGGVPHAWARSGEAPALRAASAIRTSSPSCVLAASTTGLPRFSLSKMEANSALVSLRSAICWSN